MIRKQTTSFAAIKFTAAKDGTDLIFLNQYAESNIII